MRRLLWPVVAALACGASAQTPDVSLRGELRYWGLSRVDGESQARWYDPMGRHSVVGLQTILEPGYRALVTQRLQRIDGDADRELIDEAYIEDPGIWRVGRQVLPFGDRSMLRETALAARGDTRLVLNDLPIRVAVCDNGAGKTRGVVGRIGTRIGISFAVGDHFGAQGSALTPYRRPEDSPGKGGGYRVAAGVDAGKRFGPVEANVEAITLRRPDRAADRALDLTDMRLTVRGLDDKLVTTAGWCREWRTGTDVLRFQAELSVAHNVWVASFVRVRRGSIQDIAVGARVKL